MTKKTLEERANDVAEFYAELSRDKVDVNSFISKANDVFDFIPEMACLVREQAEYIQELKDIIADRTKDMWFKIESAPKNKEILLKGTYTDIKGVIVGIYLGKHTYENTCWNDWPEGWYEVVRTYGFHPLTHKDTLTHWMPLPK